VRSWLHKGNGYPLSSVGAEARSHTPCGLSGCPPLPMGALTPHLGHAILVDVQSQQALNTRPIMASPLSGWNFNRIILDLRYTDSLDQVRTYGVFGDGVVLDGTEKGTATNITPLALEPNSP
jgi:hypothetical protein